MSVTVWEVPITGNFAPIVDKGGLDHSQVAARDNQVVQVHDRTTVLPEKSVYIEVI